MERTGIVDQKQEEVFGIQMSKKEIKKLGRELGQILSRDVLRLIETDEFKREYQAWKLTGFQTSMMPLSGSEEMGKLPKQLLLAMTPKFYRKQ